MLQSNRFVCRRVITLLGPTSRRGGTELVQQRFCGRLEELGLRFATDLDKCDIGESRFPERSHGVDDGGWTRKKKARVLPQFLLLHLHQLLLLQHQFILNLLLPIVTIMVIVNSLFVCV